MEKDEHGRIVLPEISKKEFDSIVAQIEKEYS